MGYYAYIPTKDGKEPLGTENRLIIRDLKTVRGVINRCKTAFKDKTFKLYSFTNFYDGSTYKEIAV